MQRVAQRVELKPSNITSVHAWNAWVKSRTSKAFQEKSDWYRGLRRAQIPHTTSRKGMHRLAHEMKSNTDDPKKINRSKVWIAGHTHSDGRPVRPEFADTFEQIQTLDSQMDSTSGDNIREDAMSKILGKDKPGRVRDLYKLFHDLAGNKGNPGDMASQNEVGDVNRGVKCQILAWYANEDVVVTEGEFCSADKDYKIGKISIGRNAAAVIIKTVLDIEAADEASAREQVSPREAVMRRSSESTSYSTSTTKSPKQKCILLDFNNSGCTIAEGKVCSTNPTDLVHHVPLGENVSKVWVEVVKIGEAAVWRPNSEVVYISDALGTTVAWPNDKLLFL
ncbi:unnamed protein product [Microthlaspi erraticum]|uniref:DUF8039 domain-containing protein n=1 Tax=Microthlaspi erraticum TaxID=1685480 RepID=A0A6D2I1A8_9BRAS|nr:unnamed protein product [Microthlaspi erraticum]